MTCPAAKLVSRRYKDDPEYPNLLAEARAELQADQDAWDRQIAADAERLGEEELLGRLGGWAGSGLRTVSR